MLNLKQFAPFEFCLRCFGCCRFSKKKTIWAPAGLGLKSTKYGYSCPYLNELTNRCNIYSRRPLDCRLYPFLLVKNERNLSLGLHKSCCFIAGNGLNAPAINEYTRYLVQELNKKEFSAALKHNPRLAAGYKDNVEILAKTISLPALNRLRLQDRPLFEGYLKNARDSFSGNSFAGIFIWKRLFKIFWTQIKGSLCIFYQDRIGMFMTLPPLGRTGLAVIRECFAVMSFYNQGSQVSRIENVIKDNLRFYRRLGLLPKLKDQEYIYLRQDLVRLSGDKFRHKRASCNHFTKNYKAEIFQYQSGMYEDCIKLYRLWQKMRQDNFESGLYRQMLEDGFSSFELALRHYQALGLAGLVVKVGGMIKACSFGYPLNKKIFCVLFEICDLRLKGIAQFIFREFCKRLSGYKYINVMGASGLDSLERTKLSYRPIREINLYNIYLDG